MGLIFGLCFLTPDSSPAKPASLIVTCLACLFGYLLIQIFASSACGLACRPRPFTSSSVQPDSTACLDLAELKLKSLPRSLSQQLGSKPTRCLKINRANFTFSVCFSSSFQNYVACALGIHFIGFVMMCSGATNALCSFIVGRLSQYMGRPALFSLGIVSYIAYLTLFY